MIVPDYNPASRSRRFWITLVFFASLVATCCPHSPAYSVLTHEEIIDLVWASQLGPLIKARFPGLSQEQLKDAHAYAYGGAVIQDLGYYPFGSDEFSDLVHYVRSGDFVAELVKESADANEYAFALGALAHYASDISGHPAVNRSVAIEYPQLGAKYGSSVTYDQNKTAHLRTEFGFDMVQVAKQRYAPQQYHDFIGFKVSKPLLERAFPAVYGLPLKDILAHEDLAIGSYRYSVSHVIPKMTQVALASRGKQMLQEEPNFDKHKFLYRLSRADYEKEWGKEYQRAGAGTRVLAFFIRLLPKVGPFRALAFKNPTAQTEDLYFRSINLAVDDYSHLLEETKLNALHLPNYDFDTGKETAAAEYPLSDETYAKLVLQLAATNFSNITPDLRTNILHFYANPSAPIATKKNKGRWNEVLAALDKLKAGPGVPSTPTAGSATGQ